MQGMVAGQTRPAATPAVAWAAPIPMMIVVMCLPAPPLLLYCSAIVRVAWRAHVHVQAAAGASAAGPAGEVDGDTARPCLDAGGCHLRGSQPAVPGLDAIGRSRVWPVPRRRARVAAACCSCRHAVGELLLRTGTDGHQVPHPPCTVSRPTGCAAMSSISWDWVLHLG